MSVSVKSVDPYVFQFSFKSKLALAEINRRRNVKYQYLKPLQSMCLKHAMHGDVLAVLPTGYGKSLIFEMLPLMSSSSHASAVIICTPLNSIIEEQIVRYGEYAVQVKGGAKKDHLFQEAKYTYAIGHPEDLVKEETFRNKCWQEKVSHIIVDEAHCIIQWGRDFRKDFQKLPVLLSWFPHAKIVAMTATATVSTRDEICKTMQMKSCHIVATSIDRPNLKLIVHKRPPVTGGKSTTESSLASVLDPLIKEIDQERDNFKKTIVYSNLKNCGSGYEQCVRTVPATLVCQYHAACKEEMKKQTVQSIARQDGPRILFATEAYSMGTDAPDIRRVIHIGPPSSLETYVQEIGRAGRDGQYCEAILHFNSTDIAANKPGMTTAVRDYCRSDSCRRTSLCEFFGFDVEETGPGHLCCDNCAAVCKCEECANKQDADNKEDATEMLVSMAFGGDSNMYLILKDLLEQYFSSECEYEDLNEEMVNDLASLGKECTVSILKAKYPTLDDVIVQNIVGIISHAHIFYQTA